MVEVEGNSRTQVPCVGGMEKNWGRALSRKGIRKKKRRKVVLTLFERSIKKHIISYLLEIM